MTKDELRRAAQLYVGKPVEPDRHAADLMRDEGSGGGNLRRDLRAVSNSPGAAPLWAAWRAGLKDLQDLALQAFPDSHATRDEPGAIGSPTQAIVTSEITGRPIGASRSPAGPSPEMDI